MNSIDKLACHSLRKRVFIIGYQGGMAHLASCFSSIEILYTLYMKGVMNHDPQKPDMIDRDRFVLSKGHSALALYAVLELAGYITSKEMNSYLKDNAIIGGEPNYGDVHGIEASTGSLGHGLSVAIGMALAQKYDGNCARTFVLIGDGESQEGSIWEAATTASSFSLDNLIAILDYNRLQKTTRVDETMKCIDWQKKWEAFGWNVLRTDGHDTDFLQQTLLSIKPNGKPTIIVADTVKGKGVSIMENNPKWHFKLPNRKEMNVFLKELDLPFEELEG